MALTAASITGTLVEIDDVWDVLAAAGFSEEDYTPATKNAAFYWVQGTTYVVLADADMNILYPEDLDVTGKELIPLIGDPNRLNPADKPQADVLTGNFSSYDAPFAEGTGYLFAFRTDHDLNGENAEDPELVAKQEKYGEWLADFAIILNDDFEAGSAAICGQYFGIPWQDIVLPDDASAGTCFLLMKDAYTPYESFLTYETLLDACKSDGNGNRDSFNCGTYAVDESAVGKSITVELRLYEPSAEDPSVKSDKYMVCTTVTVTFITTAEVN